MAIPFYLAMTPQEFQSIPTLPQRTAWMGCRFSREDPGLSDLPDTLPPGSLLTVNDSFPLGNHDQNLILEQLTDTVTQLGCDGVVLDFQGPWSENTAGLVRYLSAKLPSPMAVSELYAKDTHRSIFLSPTPADTSLAHHLNPWKDREVWLDLAPGHQTMVITESGAHYAPWDPTNDRENYFPDAVLHTHYRIETGDSLRFPMFRTAEDLLAILSEAEKYHVTKAVGLYQEWKKSPGLP